MILDKTSLCNEVLRDLPFAEQCRVAAQLGYAGLEVAPFTLSNDPATLSAQERRGLRTAAEEAGIAITGLHWLMNVPEGLSITDPEREAEAIAHIEAMIALCADLGGSVLIHGSPGQRQLADAPSAQAGRDTARAVFEKAGAAAQAAGVVYCLEPLTPQQTDYLTTLADAVALVHEIASPGITAMLDVCAASAAENESPADLLRLWVPQGVIGHIHLNAANRKAPGQDETAFAPILRAAIESGYAGRYAVEPFIYEPDGIGSASWAAGYLSGLNESLESPR